MPSKNLKSQSANLKATTQSSKVSKKDTKVVAKSSKVAKKKTEEKVEVTVPVQLKTARKKVAGAVTADVYDIKGKVIETITLPAEIFGAKVNSSLMAQAVRVYLANQRRGTASTKTRGEVEGSTRKIYKQKGTGRARHGSMRAPIFVHGGIAFGPKPRDYSLNLPRKMKKAALSSALSAKVKEGKMRIVTGLEKLEPKTKLMVEVIKNLGINDRKIMLVLSDKTENVKRAARNIERVNITSANQLNTYSILNNNVLLVSKVSLESIEKVFKGE